MSTFLIINTGGTIGMVPSKAGLTPKAGVISEAMQQHPELADWQQHELIWQHWSPLLDSSDLQPQHWFALRDAIEKQQAIDGVLIIHGTDTLSYSAAALSFLLHNTPIPVVLTGSMLPILDDNTDAVDNLRLSLQALTSDLNEVLVAVGPTLLPASLTTKKTTLADNAFDALAWQEDWTKPATEPFQFQQPWQQPSVAVAVFTLFPGFDPSQIQRAVDTGNRAILINAFGNGNAASSNEMKAALLCAKRAKVPVFVRSQCYEGLVSLGQYASSGVFSSAGAISCGLMPFEAALTKILLLCNELQDSEAIKQAFNQPLCREWQTTPAH